MITIRYEISEKAARKEFIENGVYYDADNYGRWLEVSCDQRELTSNERALIWDLCAIEGHGYFRFDEAYIHQVCKSVKELLDIIRDENGEQ